MLKDELLALIKNGESSGVQFTRDDVLAERLAREIVAVANLQGGRVLLGVEDDGSISGIARADLETWLMGAASCIRCSCPSARRWRWMTASVWPCCRSCRGRARGGG